jgi:uncharacterized membrane protein YedE/YeeE
MPELDALFPMGIAHYAIGGLLISFGVSYMFASTGLVGGMSTFSTSTWSFLSKASYFNRDTFTTSRNWRLVYAAGLILGAAIWQFTVGDTFVTQVGYGQLLLGGLIAGFGARLSNGCTSGHGICGLASFKLPSLLAVLIFLSTAMIAANLVKILGGF